MPQSVWDWADPIAGQNAFVSTAGNLWGNWIGYQEPQNYWDDWAKYDVWEPQDWRSLDVGGGQYNNQLYAFSTQSYDPWSGGAPRYAPTSNATYAVISNDIWQWLEREHPDILAFQSGITPGFGEVTSGLDSTWADVDSWDGVVLAASRQYNVPANLMKAIMYLESGGVDLDINGANAVGPMQVTTDNWGADAERLGLNLYNAPDNIKMGAYILRQMYDTYKDWATTNGIDPWKAATYAYYAGSPYNLNAADKTEQGGSGMSTGEYGDEIWANYMMLNTGKTATTPTNGSYAGMPEFWALTQGQSYPITQEMGGQAMDYSNYDWTLGITGHPGIDIGTPYGTKAFTPVAGTVIADGATGSFVDDSIGNQPHTGELRIELDNGDQIIIGHMSNVAVTVGTRVTPGQYVGDSGTAGTGPHIHMEYRKIGNYPWGQYQAIDPRLALAGIFTGTFTDSGGQNALYRAGADNWNEFMRAVSTGAPVSGYSAGSAKANFHNFIKKNMTGEWNDMAAQAASGVNWTGNDVNQTGSWYLPVKTIQPGPQ